MRCAHIARAAPPSSGITDFAREGIRRMADEMTATHHAERWRARVSPGARDASSRTKVPVIELVHGGALAKHLRSEAVQGLMSGRVDFVEIKCVKSYIGQASLQDGLRRIRFSVHPPVDEETLSFIICHELAHHVVGPREKHSDAWREACAELVREAGERGLLSAERVEQALAMTLNGSATKFQGWPDQAQEQRAVRERHRESRLDQLREAGLCCGGQVYFRYRGTLYHAEVMRVNQTTVSVGAPGSGQISLRVPFGRVLGVKQD